MMKRFYSQSKGNLSLLLLVDSSKKSGYSFLEETTFSALEHFGMPYRIIDLSKDSLSIDDLLSCSGIIVPQEHLGGSLSLKNAEDITKAVGEGIGLVNFDGFIKEYPSVLEDIFGFSASEGNQLALTGSLKVSDNIHYITHTREVNEIIYLKKTVEGIKISQVKRNIDVLLRDQNNYPMLLAISFRKGRAVQFLFSPKLYSREFLGHAHGLDDVFWKSIVWAAKKPFLMKAMPPFVTAKVDDVSGSNSLFGKREDSANSHFRYLDSLNEHGYLPNIGLYIDDIGNEDGKVIKLKYDAKLADFSPHAFRDPKNIREKPIYMKRDGSEFTEEELKRNIAKVDAKFAKWGTKLSKVLTSHFGEVGLNALPFLKGRGAVFSTVPMRFGKLYTDPKAWDWNPKPYSNPGYVFDFMPDHPDFFCVVCTYEQVGIDDYAAPHFDFLFSCTPFWNENPYSDVKKAAERGAEHIKRGLDSLFFGCLLTHEQRIASLSIKEWNEILSRIDELTSKYDKIFKNFEYICQYANNKVKSRIREANYNPHLKEIKCTLEGETDMPLQLYVFIDKDRGVEYKFESVPTFDDSTTISFRMEK